MLDEIVEYLRVPIKEWGGTVLAAIFTLAGIVYSQRWKVKSEREQRIHDEAKSQRDGNRTFDIAATQDLTARFKALMDGYEARIIDLTNELKATKLELREAREEIAKLREQLSAA